MEFFVFTYSIVLISIKSLHNTANFLNLDLETYLSTKVTSNFRLGGNSIGVRIRGNLFSIICFLMFRSNFFGSGLLKHN